VAASISGRVDGHDGTRDHGIRQLDPQLEQLSVAPPSMRRGIGRALLERVRETVGHERVWLTTYDHLPWNRPFYERFGFARAPDADHGPELREALAEQR
jgi:GNAT superfamily N-acetyltransferase